MASGVVRRAKRACLRCIRRILFPPTAVALASPLLIGLLMAWAFAFGGSTSPLAPIAYASSAVLLLSFSSWLLRAASSGCIRSAIEKRPSVMRLATDAGLRRRGGLLAGAFVDILWAILNLAFAVSQSSVWLLTLGLYYLTFGVLRSRLYSLMRKDVPMKVACEESKKAGVALVVSVFVLSGIVVLAIKHKEAVSYGDIGIYAAATFSFYSLVVSVSSFAKHRKHEDVTIATCCCVNVAISIISIVVLETAMLATFSSDGEEASVLFLSISGFVAALLLVSLGAFTIINADRSSRPAWRQY